MDELTELGQKLFNPDAPWLDNSIVRRPEGDFIIMCDMRIDNEVYPSLEEATLRWIQLRIEGKI